MSETAELVERSRRGDTLAFGELYDRHARLIRAICYDATKQLDAAEDLTQEVFLRAFERLRQLRDDQRFAAWLCEIARCASRDWQRKNHRSSELSDAISPADLPTPDENSQISELREAILKLPDDERFALHLFYLEEQPAAIARECLGLSQSGFYKLLERAREHAGAIMRRNQEASR